MSATPIHLKPKGQFAMDKSYYLGANIGAQAKAFDCGADARRQDGTHISAVRDALDMAEKLASEVNALANLLFGPAPIEGSGMDMGILAAPSGVIPELSDRAGDVSRSLNRAFEALHRINSQL